MSTLEKLFQQAIAAMNGGKPLEAELAFKKLLKKEPSNVPALNLLTVVLMGMERYAEAEPFISRAIRLNQSSDASYYNYGLISKRLGKTQQAMEHFCNAIRLNARVPEAWNNRGTVFNDLKQYENAITDFNQALSLAPNYPDAFCNKGKSLGLLKRYDEAVVAYDKALALKPDFVEAWLGRGNILSGVKRYDEAVVAYDKALALKPDLAEAWLGRGDALNDLKRHDEAIAAYDKAVALKPRSEGVWLGRGNAFAGLKRHDEAFAAYENALAFAPDLEGAWLGRGNLLHDLKRHDEACAAYEKALEIQPDLAEAWLGRGNIYCDLGRYDKALAAYDEALTSKPALAEAWLGRGNAFLGIRRYDDAFAAYDKALALKPDLAEAWLGRGNILWEYNSIDAALAGYQKALEIRKDFFAAKAARCLAELQLIYEDEGEIASRRASYQAKLAALSDEVKAGHVSGDRKDLFKSKLPFYLAYQGHNDRDLQRLYGSMASHIMQAELPSLPLAHLAGPNEKIRIGFVSRFFHDHSNWKIPIKGWLGQLDRNRFAVLGYHVGSDRDSETDKASAMCDRFVQGMMSVDAWRKEIMADAPHVLIYPGLFMDEISLQLAAQRLAPVQCNSWGHPETSGLDTLDYYLSSDLMEPPDASEHYTEKLIRLPNLSIYYEPVENDPLIAMSREQLGLRQDALVFWCGQSLYKYLPQYDEVFARIAESVVNCQFVFIGHSGAEQITEIFRGRLERAFALRNRRSSDHCVILPRLKPGEFVAAIGCCDIFLDSIGWSGCNSTLEGLAHNHPIITMEGPLMRGRHSAAILRMMDATETIAKSVDEFVSLAIRLANRPDERKSASQQIASNKHRLYRDRACIEALEKFLDDVARQRD
jgi:protein O-GlcNAc transferase